jgi:creatinine amidohydrolase
VTTSDHDLGRMTSPAFAALVDGGRPVAALVPIGSTEPHGPHLALATDVVISRGACERAAAKLDAAGIAPVIAPSIAYGVTDCAAGFAGAISIPATVLASYVRSVADALLGAGCAHVCLVNDHLEPAHDAAVRAAAIGETRISVACPLTRRWARTLTPEFKSGACHAGQYETSIVLAVDPSLVDDKARAALPAVPISLSDGLRDGKPTFVAMGLDRAYAGDPAAATAAEGNATLDLLAEMIATEVLEALAVLKR